MPATPDARTGSIALIAGHAASRARRIVGALGVLLFGAALGGCATTNSLPGVDAKALQQRSLAVRTGSTPSFYADTPDRRAYGMLGVVAMLRSGNQLVEEFGLKDPAAIVSQELAASLMDGNQMKIAAADQADLLLDVQTINWDFRPYKRNAKSLFVVYSARVTLTDRRTGEQIAAGKCRSQRDADSDSATVDELLADGAKRLHAELHEAGLECVQRMKRETLSALLGTSVAPVAQQQSQTAPTR